MPDVYGPAVLFEDALFHAPSVLFDDETWVTINGRHVLIGADGKPQYGGTGGSGGSAGKSGGKAAPGPSDRLLKDHIRIPESQRASVGAPKGYVNLQKPTGDTHILWKGQDSKGRWKQQSHVDHENEQAAIKWARGRDFQQVAGDLHAQAEKGSAAGNDTALVTRLLMLTGARVGGERDTLAKAKAYGASTLLAEHASVSGNTVTLDFVGKEGIRNLYEVDDPLLAKVISERKAAGGRLFSTNDSKVRDYIKKTTGNPEFKTKDIRTWVATTTASDIIDRMAAPTSEREFKGAQMDVATQVSGLLNNKPAQALKSYIDPEVFNGWKASLGMS